jgi:hypothetical protein
MFPAKMSSVALKLLPKSSSSHWLATLRSVAAACNDSIDIDSFVDVMMSLWYELHHERMDVMVRSLQLANKASKTLTIDGTRLHPIVLLRISHPCLLQGSWKSWHCSTQTVWRML